MVRIFIFILICITIAYWIGYHVGKSQNNFRPICFLTYGEPSTQGEPQTSEIYWGYFDKIYTNTKNLEYFKSTIDGHDVYFVIERSALIEAAQGQKVYATVNIGKFSNRKNPYYLSYLLRHGKHILLEK